MPSQMESVEVAIKANEDDETFDKPPGTATHFPGTQLESLDDVPEEENDYIAEVFDAPEPDNIHLEAVHVRWVSKDRYAPDYNHLLVDGGENLSTEKNFEIGKEELELLIAANYYLPIGAGDIIAFGIRGAKLRGAEKYEQVDRCPLEDTRPDHRNFRCVVGFYFRQTGKLSAFTGSTVPWHRYMSKRIKNNLLPTGCYIYKIGTHSPITRSRWVTPALRLSDANGSWSGPATVLRTKNDLIFGLADKWDKCKPSDNVHCAYKNSAFSSLGCQTVKGGMNDGLWADFQNTLGPPLKKNDRIDYVLVTGAEVSIAASLVGASKRSDDAEVVKRLRRLRAGSQGDVVKRLQTKLSIKPSGYFGAATKKALADYQNANNIPADGIYSPALDAKLGWEIFKAPPHPSDGRYVDEPKPPGRYVDAPTVQPDTVVTDPAIPSPAPVRQPTPTVREPVPVGPKPEVSLTHETLKEFAPRARAEYLAVLAGEGNAVLTKYGINKNKRRFCHFMAQVSHECGGFRITHESLKYSAKRMVQVFGRGRHSARLTLNEAKRLVGNEEAFAERVYGLGNPRKARDLGNTQPGDGYRYRGRGFLQITGRAAYREMGRKIGVDIEADPDKVAEPLYALMTAAAFWDNRRLNRYADRNDIILITKRINGGRNGLSDRKRRYSKARNIWSGNLESLERPDLEAAEGRPILEYGSFGPDVARLKMLLVEAGYHGFVMDEDFRRATHMAVVRFKIDHGMVGDGIVDAPTWDSLETPRRGAPLESSDPTDEFHEIQKERSRSRTTGRAVWCVGLGLLLATLAYVAIRVFTNEGLQSLGFDWWWTELIFVTLVGLVSLALVALGSRIVQANEARAMALEKVDPEALNEEHMGTRSEVNLEGVD